MWTISGTLRVFSNELYRTLSHKIATLMQGLETATGAQIDIERKVRYPSVRNPRELVEQFYAVLDSMDDAVLVEPVMAAEDFAEYQQEIPGLFFFLESDCFRRRRGCFRFFSYHPATIKLSYAFRAGWRRCIAILHVAAVINPTVHARVRRQRHCGQRQGQYQSTGPTHAVRPP